MVCDQMEDGRAVLCLNRNEMKRMDGYTSRDSISGNEVV